LNDEPNVNEPTVTVNAWHVTDPNQNQWTVLGGSNEPYDHVRKQPGPTGNGLLTAHNQSRRRRRHGEQWRMVRAWGATTWQSTHMAVPTRGKLT
jgi:hypothetical protein